MIYMFTCKIVRTVISDSTATEQSYNVGISLVLLWQLSQRCIAIDSVTIQDTGI